MAGRIAPTGKCQSGCLVFFRISVLEETITGGGVALLSLSVSGAAVFAKPTVAEIEKVVCLIHEYQRSEVRGQRLRDRKSAISTGGSVSSFLSVTADR